MAGLSPSATPRGTLSQYSVTQRPVSVTVCTPGQGRRFLIPGYSNPPFPIVTVSLHTFSPHSACNWSAFSLEIMENILAKPVKRKTYKKIIYAFTFVFNLRISHVLKHSKSRHRQTDRHFTIAFLYRTDCSQYRVAL